jgi:hypothetical protein
MRFLPAVFFLILTAFGRAQEASVPDCPADHVLDQTGKVTDAERASIKVELDLAASKSGLGVYLVLLNSVPEVPPMELARWLAQSWTGSDDRVVLLSGPGVAPPVVIAFEGKSLSAAPKDQVVAMTTEALSAGRRAGKGLPVMLATARSVISQIEVLHGGGSPEPPAAAAPRPQEIRVPDRPADHILDQTGKVTDAERASVKMELDLAASKSSLGVYLVLLNSAPEEPPMDLARRLAQSWKGSADRVVLLSGPGVEPPVVIAVAGESLGAAAEQPLEAMKRAALSAGKKAGAGLPALLETARSVIGQIGVFRGGGSLGPPPAELSAAEEPHNYLTAWIAGGALVCCLLALVLMRRGRQTALIFPPHEFRHRFSAPHSGGNDAMVFFGKEK